MSYQCATCGKVHDGLPDVGFKWPDSYFGVPEAERAARVSATADTCIIDDEHFFIRGTILIPLLGQDSCFGIGVWVSQKRESFNTYLEKPDTAEIGPFFGWLSNSISFYERDTWALQTVARFQGSGQRPVIEIQPSDHRLYVDCRDGITLEHAWEYVHWKARTH